jgi:HEAT repeat protein
MCKILSTGSCRYIGYPKGFSLDLATLKARQRRADMENRHRLELTVFLIIIGLASTAVGDIASPYSTNFDIRNMIGFNDSVISSEEIVAFIQEKYPNSPMLDEPDIGDCFISAGRDNNVNPAFLVASACLEGGFGTLGWAQSHPECHNTFGYGIPTGDTPPDDINCMDSWCVMIQRVASVIAHGHNYYTQGLYTVSQIRAKYAASPNSDSIASLMNELYAFSISETDASNATVEESLEAMGQSQTQNSLELPIQVLSPVMGPMETVSDVNDCSGTKWCFNQHKTGMNGIGHIPGGGVGKADDTYAWDANLNTADEWDLDNGKPVYAVAPGVVCQTYGSKKNADDIGGYGQVLIEHSYQGKKWWSGYLHLTNIQVVKGQAVTEETILGNVSQVGADNSHLHFVVYTGENSEGKLRSFDAQISQRGSSSTAEGNVQDSSISSTQPANLSIALTLYFHEGDANGPIIQGALVSGHDGSGNGFQSITDANGYVVISGDPGIWSFEASADGYETGIWDQGIADTCARDAFLQRAESNTQTALADDVDSNITALKDADPSVRIRAIDSLAEIADLRALNPLIEALNDEDSSVRMQAVRALGEINDSRAIDPLSYTSVKDADYYVREEAKKVLQWSTIGGNRVDARSSGPIIGALTDADPDVRIRAAEALGQIKNAAAVDPLIVALNDGNSDVRRYSSWALGEVNDSRAIDPLSYTSVKDADYYVREEAKKVLQWSTIGGNKVDSRSTESIIGALTDADPDVRIRAAEALGQIKNAIAVDPLIVALNDENSDVRRYSASALGEINDSKAIDPLSYTSVKDADYYVREEAKAALLWNAIGGNKVDARSVGPIIGALADADQDVRIRAAEALGQIKNAIAVDPLIASLNDENSDVRLKAAWALGEINDSRAVDSLSRTSVEDADYYVREEAKNALERFG